MNYDQPVIQLIRKRFSCRTYDTNPISEAHLDSLIQFADDCRLGPLGSRPHFKIVASREGDSQALRGLGTYGFIKNPVGFILGACSDAPGSLEDFGYLLEAILLRATDLGIGTCWLGGTFTKSRFVQKMDLQNGEFIPSVASIGYPSDDKAWMDRMSRLYAGADRRFAWNDLFYQDQFGKGLAPSNAGEYQEPIECVRLAPSASNKQPWRIVKIDRSWHFYLKRTPNYPVPIFNSLVGIADLQRIDLGIAMSHFELSAKEIGLTGSWNTKDPGIELPDKLTEYTTSWYADASQ